MARKVEKGRKVGGVSPSKADKQPPARKARTGPPKKPSLEMSKKRVSKYQPKATPSKNIAPPTTSEELPPSLPRVPLKRRPVLPMHTPPTPETSKAMVGESQEPEENSPPQPTKTSGAIQGDLNATPQTPTPPPKKPKTSLYPSSQEIAAIPASKVDSDIPEITLVVKDQEVNAPLTPRQRRLISEFKKHGMEPRNTRIVNQPEPSRQSDDEPTMATEQVQQKRPGLPLLSTLSDEACQFIWSVFGMGDEFPPMQHVDCPLHCFTPIFRDDAFNVIANSQRVLFSGEKQYRIQLRYFGGLYFGEGSVESTDSFSVNVYKNLVSFFKGKFNREGHNDISECVKRSRTIYITALHEQTSLEGPNTSTTVSALNFAKVGEKGIFLNYLGTNKDVISREKFGDCFSTFECGGNMFWRNRHFAHFLIVLAKMTMETYLFQNNLHSPSQCYVILQTRTEEGEGAAKYYDQLGFDDRGHIESISELDRSVFVGFNDIIEAQKDSKSDFAHFLFHDVDDLNIFIHSGYGTLLQPIKTFNAQINEWTIRKPQKKTKVASSYVRLQESDRSRTMEEVEFPFHIRKEDLLTLVSDLEFFYIPFVIPRNMHQTVALEKYLQPCKEYPEYTSIVLKGKDNEWSKIHQMSYWLKDDHIDFFSRW